MKAQAISFDLDRFNALFCKVAPEKLLKYQSIIWHAFKKLYLQLHSNYSKMWWKNERFCKFSHQILRGLKRHKFEFKSNRNVFEFKRKIKPNHDRNSLVVIK